jgi:phosphoribosylglycinamide formyltransferase-1
MKFAVICSAGGSAFFAAFDMLAKTNRYSKDNFILITDRACGAEQAAIVRGMDYQRINFESKEQFSKNVADLLVKEKVSIVLMLYSRLITSDLFLTFPTLNIHPALLPAFKGINAVNQALDSGVKFIGATLHVTTEKMDDGAIVAQVVSPIKIRATKEQLNQLSFLQKTYLILMMLDCIRQNFVQLSLDGLMLNWIKETKFTSSANPCIQSKDLIDMFDAYQKSVEMGNAIQ